MSNRIDRANSQIQKALQTILHDHMNDPRIDDFVGVSEVKVTPDFRFCKVKISITDGNYSKADTVISVLKKSEGYIKHLLSEMLDMPHIPKLDFIFDKNMLNAIRINELLNGLKIPPKDEGEENDEV